MNRLASVLIAATVACAPGVEWTRFQGTVKGINLKAQTITIEDKQGAILVVPWDHQVKIIERNASKRLQDVSLDAKVTLIRTPAEPEIQDNSDLAPFKGR